MYFCFTKHTLETLKTNLMAILSPPESIGTIPQLLAVSVLNWQGLALIVQLWALAGRDKARKTGGVALLLKKLQVSAS